MSNSDFQRTLVLEANTEASLNQFSTSERLSLTGAFELLQYKFFDLLADDSSLQKLIIKDRNLYEYKVPATESIRIIMEVRAKEIAILQVFEKDKSKHQFRKFY
jgi:hypothetical protein